LVFTHPTRTISPIARPPWQRPAGGPAAADAAPSASVLT
jgi:hypothetical protein